MNVSLLENGNSTLHRHKLLQITAIHSNTICTSQYTCFFCARRG